MQMNTLAEHPEVVANRQVLRQDVKGHAPGWIFHNHLRRLNDRLIPENPRSAAKR